MKRVYFIFNLHSGKAALNNQIPKLLDQFTAAGYEVTVHPTQRQGDGIVSAKYACEHGFDLLVCAGGDGTLNETIQGCMNCENPLPVGYIQQVLRMILQEAYRFQPHRKKPCSVF